MKVAGLADLQTDAPSGRYEGLMSPVEIISCPQLAHSLHRMSTKLSSLGARESPGRLDVMGRLSADKAACMHSHLSTRIARERHRKTCGRSRSRMAFIWRGVKGCIYGWLSTNESSVFGDVSLIQISKQIRTMPKEIAYSLKFTEIPIGVSGVDEDIERTGTRTG